MRIHVFILCFVMRASHGLELSLNTDGTCTQYIESASWTERYDPGTQKNEWSLAVIPTPCGRAIQSDQTNAEYAELVQKFAGDWQWKNNDGGGMRRQLVCHLTIAREKTPWNLEPYRPDVTQEVSVKNGCNNALTSAAPGSFGPPGILVPGEGATVATPFMISGKSAANATIDVCLEGAGYCFGKPVADGNGDWFIEGARLNPGTYRFTARQTLNGQVSSWAGNRTITVP